MSTSSDSVQAAQRRPAGRPKSMQKREQIVSAARQLFPERGISALTMSDVATRAGVAKQTLYSHFGSKEALFAEVVARMRGERSPATAPPNSAEVGGIEHPLILTDPDILVALAGLGSYLVELVVDPELAALRRIMIGEALPPHWNQVWAADGPDRLRDSLVHDLAARVEFDVPDPPLAADQFLALVTHRATMDSLNRVDPPEDPTASYRIVQSCQMFLHCYRATGSRTAEPLAPGNS